MDRILVPAGRTLLAALALLFVLPRPAAAQSDDQTPWPGEREFWVDVVGPGEVEVGEPVVVVLRGDADPADPDGIFEARHLDGDDEPIRPPAARNEDGLWQAVFEFPETGRWEILALTDITGDAPPGTAPGGWVVEVVAPTPWWVMLTVIGGLVVLVGALSTYAVSRSARRPAPWDRTGTAGNPLSDEPR
jgi:hypothetical protein